MSTTATGSMIRESIDSIDALGGILLDIETRVVNADYVSVLAPFQQDLAEQHAEMFTGQHDANGNAWAPLAESTIKRKGHSRILYESGDLAASLVTVGAAHNISAVAERGSLFGTDVEYAGFLQTGTSRMPARPPVGVSEENITKLTNQIADATVEKMK